MRRGAFAMMLLGVAVLWSVQAVGAGAPTGIHIGDGVAQRVWVLVERTGLDVNCLVFSKQDEAKPVVEGLQKENAERDKANKTLKAEISKLTDQLATKKRALDKTTEPDAKGALQKEVDDLKEQIAQKKGEVKPLSTWNWPPMVFMKRDLADKFIDQVVMDAEKAKQKAAEKEAKDKPKE